ncbi:MAG: sigma 54-interacting transcriptional regulator [Polyangiaceae bacterium]
MLVALERRLRDRTAPRALLVVVCAARAVDAIANHVERIASDAVRVSSAAGVDGWREALRLAVPPSSHRIHGALVVHGARDLAERLNSDRTIVHADPTPTAFSTAVAREVAGRLAAEALPGAPIVWVRPAVGWTSSNGMETIDLDGSVDAIALSAWWPAASEQVGAKFVREAAPIADLEVELARFQAAVSRAARSRASRSLAPLEPRAQEMLSRLALAGRPWPERHLDRLLTDGAADATDELLMGGWALSADGHLRVIQPTDDLATLVQSAGSASVVAVAGALQSTFPGDPWASMRAAELLWNLPAELSHASAADSLALSAFTLVADADARADFWSRLRATRGFPSSHGAVLADLAWVELALRHGDVEVALDLARSLAAVAAEPEMQRVQLALGRALAAAGDLTTAALTLGHLVTQLNAQPHDLGAIELLARAHVELAEVQYFSGDLAEARNQATVAVSTLEALNRQVALVDRAVRATRARTQLDARNVLGKLLLAEGDFAAAERHFARDACEAALLRPEASVLELRARVNRAISVMSLARRSEAQVLLEDVLREGEAASELKAVGVALINLAALAIFDHRYGDALSLSERAVEVLRKIGDKVSLARCVANLAELRVKLGLLDEAVQAARFGARVFRGGAPGEQAAQLSLVLGRVSLAKGDTAAAQRHVVEALSAMGATMYLDDVARTVQEPQRSLGPVRERVVEALLLASRIALEDGDTTRAQVLLDRAASEPGPKRAMAELAVLTAQLSRSLGESFEQQATQALSQARDADDDELLRESHLLLFRAALVAADEADGSQITRSLSVAKHHIDAAIAVRDRVAEQLPPGLRQAFLARRDVAEVGNALSFLEGELQQRSNRSAVDSRSFSDPVVREIASARAPRAPVSSEGSPQATRSIVGDDPSMRALLVAIRKVAPSDSTILIQGESGTGKELVAEALHVASSRKGGPLVKVNCAALVETLLLSELFGHEKGAFTGAAARRRGRFEAAEGGTLFLDEIGDISHRTQVALLRVLQEKTFERVGGTTSIRANVRVVCATHRNLKALVAKGEFREDLYYRLCGVTLEVPALRARLADLPAIAAAILRRIAEERGEAVKTLSGRAVVALKSHTWPGNIRELENGLRAATLFAETNVLEPEDFAENVESLRHITIAPPTVDTPSSVSVPSAVRSGPEVALMGPVTARSSMDCLPAPSQEGAKAGPISSPPSAPADVAYAHIRTGVSLHDLKRVIERDCIARALSESSGNITRAATLLGMKRPRLSQLVKQYGLGGGSDASDGDEELSCAEEPDHG